MAAQDQGRRAALGTPLAELRAAASLLSRLPGRGADAARTGSAAFALAGAALGLLAAGAAALAGPERTLLGAVAAVGVLALVSGALHLDGLADTADALAAPDDDGADRARRDPAIGAAGAAALTLVLFLDVTALAALRPLDVAPALVVAGSVSRALPALAAPWAPRAEGGFGAWFAAHSGRGGSVAALGTSLAVVLLAPGLVPAVGWLTGLAAGLGLLWLLTRRFGTITGDGYGAAIEVAFAASLVAQAVVR